MSASGSGYVSVREGKFDVAILAGPRVVLWPSAGVRELARLCAEMGLSVGVFGGDSMTVRGVIPLPGTGGIVLIEDVQKRIHRIHARAIVKVCQDSRLPDPFPGWRSQGLIPLSTAERLFAESHVQWDPATVVLGTGNEALRFASRLIESGAREVYCVETSTQWGAKRFAGWEVERRRFESQGGKLIEARPVSLLPKAALLWEVRLQDAQGVRVIDVGRVVSAGPFRDLSGVREHPPGSSLFELEQTARARRDEDVEGWAMEEERGRWLAGRIVKSLATGLGDRKEELERVFRRARGRIKRYFMHREAPFTPAYQGKWLATADLRRIKAFKGVPQADHKARLVASVECFEDIPCNICMTVCPTQAIEIGRVPRQGEKGGGDSLLTESKCISCGICSVACPSAAIPMVHEKTEHSMSVLVLPWRGKRPWKVGEFAIAVNRRGESLGNVRVTALPEPGAMSPRPGVAWPAGAAAAGSQGAVQLVQVELPTHLLWEARGLRRARAAATEDEAYMVAVERSAASGEKVEITLNGEKRMVRDKITVATALFEIGQSRADDVLFCPDGSCGLCQVSVDGVSKLACSERIHRGMAIRLGEEPAPKRSESSLCPCLGISVEQVVERLKQGNLQSPEAVLSVTHVGEGRCHGQFCMEAFRRALLNQGLDASQWSDWRFPWSEWTLGRVDS
jgi:ferredoxin